MCPSLTHTRIWSSRMGPPSLGWDQVCSSLGSADTDRRPAAGFRPTGERIRPSSRRTERLQTPSEGLCREPSHQRTVWPRGGRWTRPGPAPGSRPPGSAPPRPSSGLSCTWSPPPGHGSCWPGTGPGWPAGTRAAPQPAPRTSGSGPAWCPEADPAGCCRVGIPDPPAPAPRRSPTAQAGRSRWPGAPWTGWARWTSGWWWGQRARPPQRGKPPAAPEHRYSGPWQQRVSGSLRLLCLPLFVSPPPSLSGGGRLLPDQDHFQRKSCEGSTGTRPSSAERERETPPPHPSSPLQLWLVGEEQQHLSALVRSHVDRMWLEQTGCYQCPQLCLAGVWS